MTILDIQYLSVSYRLTDGWSDALRDISLKIETGQTYGLVGESGSGKSTLAHTVMRYLSSNGEIRGGSITFDGEDLLAKSIREMRSVWGVKLSMIPQDPLSSLNPSIVVGEQIAEISRLHERLSKKASWDRALDMLRQVKIADPVDAAKRYPHQLSGGMQQRIIIAMALSTSPRLLILDEPTTNLDVTTEASILDLVDELLQKRDSATLFVTHNMGVVARMCDNVAVLYASELMEDAPASELFGRPLHPYTQALLDCIPRVGQGKHTAVLQTIPGQIPSQRKATPSCVFAPRCPVALEVCHHVKPTLDQVTPGHTVRCHRWREIADGLLVLAKPKMLPIVPAVAPPIVPPDRVVLAHANAAAENTSLLTIDQVRVQFKSGSWLTSLIRRQPRPIVKAVDGVSLAVPRGLTVGLVGESGSGKTTLARSVIGLVDYNAGTIDLIGTMLQGRPRHRSIETLRRLQMVFQNPEESLNPYHTIGETLRRPLIRLAKRNRQDADKQVLELLRSVNLPEAYVTRYPNELSGGEKQRVAIARAFAAEPDLIICDEPVSSLDVSVQSTVLNLLVSLQNASQTAYLFISHDLAVVGYLADVIAVMYLGQIVQIGKAEHFFAPPHHPYTQGLISSIPVPDLATQSEAQGKRIHLTGEIPSAVNIPTGCRFHNRCPRFLGSICVEQEPPWQIDDRAGQYRCHIPPQELLQAQTAQGTPIQ